MPIEKVCENCGSPFTCKPSEASRRFCSKTCVLEHESKHGRPAALVDAVNFTCAHCGGIFSMKPGLLRAYRERHGKDPKYCSRDCTYAGRHAETAAKSTFTCHQCGKVQPMVRYVGTGRTVYYRQQKFCDTACKAAYQRDHAVAKFTAKLASGESLPRHQARNGYWRISVPSGITGRKETVFEHRFVMEQHLGRKLLREETVHHVDGDRGNNALSNLELFSSRHGPGQRVVDKVAFAIDMLQTYPEFARAAGFVLKRVDGECDHDVNAPEPDGAFR